MAATSKTTTTEPAADSTATADLVVSPVAPDSLWTETGQDAATDGRLSAQQLVGLDLLRRPLPAHLINLKPVNVAKEGQPSKCRVCGAYGKAHTQHLSFAGHAAITERLLAADPCWSWAPVQDPQAKGFPVMPGSLWIELTICGVTRYGVGDAEGKTGNNALKEVIGDALRNAAMRFGVGLELWHKGDLHPDPEPPAPAQPLQAAQPPRPASPPSSPSAAPDAPPAPPVEPQEWVVRMLNITSPVMTTAMRRDAGLAGHLESEVTLPTSPLTTCSLDEAFGQRLRYLQAAPVEASR